MSLKYNGKILPFAKYMRKNATPQENKLWYQFLQKYPVRFQRQKVIGDFIADFYCHTARLVIELDGSQHSSDQGIANDEARTEVLSKLNLEVLRFSNQSVTEHFDEVCERIDRFVQETIEHGENA